MFPPSSVLLPILDYGRCQACQRCQAAASCRFKAFVHIDRDEPPYIDVARCGGCGDCVRHCPFEALSSPRSTAE